MEMKYMIDSEILNKLSDGIQKAIDLITEHIKQKNPIIVRHHNDADGYSGAIAIERAITPLIYDAHSKERDMWYAYSRRPSMAPYYTYEDANKDLAYLMGTRINASKTPLIIVVDNGSSSQDLLALEKLKIYGCKIIVIEHHPNDLAVDKIVDVHINPNLVGSTYDFSAGMIAAEIANLLNPDIKAYSFIAATSGYADKVKSAELDSYFNIAKEHGYTKEFIIDMAEVIDYEAAGFGFMEAKTLVHDLFGADEVKQKQIAILIKPEISKKKAVAFNSALHYSHVSKTPTKNIVIVPVSSVSFRGEYPPTGKIVGMIHDHYSKEDLNKPTISIGFSENMATLRGTPNSNLDVNKIILELKMKFPYAQVNGGGHAKAGSIRFVPAAYDQVKNYLLELVRRD